MKFLNNWNKYKMLKEAAQGSDKMNKLFIQSVMEEYNKYSENAKEAISHVVNNTPDDVLNKIIQYIGGDIEKSKNLLTKIVTGLQKDVLTKAEPSKISYYTNKNAQYIDKYEINISTFTHTTKEVPNHSLQYATIAAGSLFVMNSSVITGDKVLEIEEEIKTALNSFDETKPIVITASCSTLRNSGDAENITWIELSQKRADAAKILIEKYKKDAKYQIDVKGKNGDGTTGNQSPYEKLIPQEGSVVDYIDGKQLKGDGVKSFYELRNIDSKFWKSASQEAPLDIINPDLSNIVEVQNNIIPKYMEFQYVNISIPIKPDVPRQPIEEIGITIGSTPIKGKIKNNHKAKVGQGKYKGECPVK
jgi:hypothetical protein